MSIVLLSNGSGSKINRTDLDALAANLNFTLPDSQDADDYLTILRSFEAIMCNIERAPDYIPPLLQPSPSTTTLRTYWKPKPDRNPFNAWSRQCDIVSSSPESNLLHGRTVAIKDNISVAGLPTTVGIPKSLFPADGDDGELWISSVDATVVSRILSAGGVIKGTSTCESFCASPLSFTSATGPVHNPRLHGYTAGGSSSGSAVLVAAHGLASTTTPTAATGGMNRGDTVELAIGSDQAGSVRIPASYNGIYGLKPTFGLVPYTGAASMSPMIDHLGPLASNLEDIAALLESMAGYDGFDPRMSPESPMRSQVKPYLHTLRENRQAILEAIRPGENLRVGLLMESFSLPGISNDVKETVYEAAKTFFEATGAAVTEISIPMHLEGPIIWTAATRPSMSSHLVQGNPSGHLSYLPPHTRIHWPLPQTAFKTLTANNPAVVNIMFSELLAKSSGYCTPGLEAKAHRKVFELRAAYDKALEEVDVLVTPCAPTVAMPHPPSADLKDGEEPSVLDRLGVAVGLTSNTCPFNITGHPGLSVPCGYSAPHRPDVSLPIGMQIVGRRWEDERVMMAAALFERGWELVEVGETQLA
ncbi:putative amidase [Aspergillus pseudoustus]|uniref:Amidase n=1 Tax=Aspergillus pseudoustus TaxID=1810923 RepID=A0ABR4L4Q1_9EURO